MVVDQSLRDLSDAEIDRIFAALADATRRDILRQSMLHDQSVSELARNYAMSFAAVQKHVAVLERAQLVTKERRGREQIVHSNPAALRTAARLLDAYEALWRDRIHRIEAILDAETPQSGTDQGTQQ
ncbi:DNA-binding transcriptional ArsR family regulator [Sinomonas atrocyanea]|jgi:DNA-binding transcriptional ArsR family regulator|uniref:ArsR/SmtB family transcription factor n=1 Tax=Sinomonas atrocyanea TaxID=37927 RepID=UPI0027831ADF|nr:winged helix-turn-helix domain-containing protein [Sinomonas atrocyanea]MDP9884931.1 DNA-binding transcriptional ArsR family regulator [Sinomonas atrocyanea]